MISNTDLQRFLCYIDGKLIANKDEKFFDCINPSNGEVFAKVADAGI